MKRPRSFYARASGLLLAALIACGAPPAAGPAPAAPPASAPPAASEAPRAAAPDPGAKPLPASVEQAEALRAQGVSWTNVEIREHYLRLIRAIRGDDERRQQGGEGAEARARKAYQTRRDARLIGRAMMSDRREVEGLRARDEQKYGRPDGPSFEQLVEHQKKKGLAGDAIYEAIVASSQRTDGAVNEVLGVKPPP
ncbi:MAG TPA: hypothetical protein VFS43_06055 [Polyangiaceae bacterium]|nr:hypothetical protein [Polyangiaceae bacterium]